MYSHILVPVVFDHGDQAALALKTAEHLAGKNGRITAIHVVEDPPSYINAYLPEGLSAKHHEQALADLNDLVSRSDHSCDVAVVHGHGASTILDYAKKHDFDCIVIASHKPGFEDYFLGSTAGHVVRHAKCCVHVIR